MTMPDVQRHALPPLSGMVFGGAPMGNLFTPVSDAQAEQTIRAAFEAGIRCFDTAPHYGLGLSEQRLGRVLGELPREELVVSTKVGRRLARNPDPQGSDDACGFAVPDDLMRVRDYSAEGILAGLEESIERLGGLRPDIVYVHDPGPHRDEALSGAVQALQSLRNAGDIAAWGIGTHQVEVADWFLQRCHPDVVMLAGRHTLLDHAGSSEFLNTCRELGVDVSIAGVYNSGILATDEPGPDARFEYTTASADLLTRALRIRDVCRDHGVSLPAAAIAFALQHEAVTSVVVGMRTPAEATLNATHAAHEVPHELWKALVEQGLIERGVT